MIVQAVSVLGALLILGAFAALQFGRTRPTAAAYLWANLTGAGLLAVVAAIESQWGFLLLESVWAAVAATTLWQRRSDT